MQRLQPHLLRYKLQANLNLIDHIVLLIQLRGSAHYQLVKTPNYAICSNQLVHMLCLTAEGMKVHKQLVPSYLAVMPGQLLNHQ